MPLQASFVSSDYQLLVLLGLTGCSPWYSQSILVLVIFGLSCNILGFFSDYITT